MTADEPAVSALYDAYYAIGNEICMRIGHEWGEERCERCHEIKEQ